MNTQLYPHLPFDDAETVQSYVRRLSLFHTGRDGSSLLKDLAIDKRAFLAGAEDAISALADASGVDADVLMRGTFVHKARHREFRGEIMSIHCLLPEGEVVCPECLKLDGVGGQAWMLKGRSAWRLRSLKTCTLHNCRLIMPTFMGGDGDSQSIFMNLANAFYLVSINQVPTDLEMSIANRLSGNPTAAGKWLDGQTIEQGSKACEMIGATLVHGLKFNHNTLSAEDWRQAGATGFEIARHGADAVTNSLGEIAAMSSTTAGQAGPKAVYGKMYEWLAYGSQALDHGPIVGLLREHILDTIVVEAGEFLLGEPVAGRRLHSVHSLSIATGLHRKRLRKILVQSGLASDDSWDLAAHRLVFDANKAELLCQDIIDSVSLQIVPEIIGCSRTQAESLFREGVIKPVIATDADHKIGKLAFAKRHLAAFIDEIKKLPEVTKDQMDSIDLVNATKRTGRSTADIMTRVIDGDLFAYRRAGDPIVSNIRFDVCDLNPIRMRQPKSLSL